MDDRRYKTKEEILSRGREAIGLSFRDIDQTFKLGIGKQSENRVAHVRPHARDSSDTYPLPDGREMSKQCFWFNRAYVGSVICGGV